MMSGTRIADNGIVLIASNYPMYGNMAFNLACTLKAESSMPIALIHDSRGIAHLSDAHLSIFDYVISIEPSEFVVRGAFCPIFIKLNLDILSPFNESLYLDVDMAWVYRKSPDVALHLLSKIGPFVMQCRGSITAEMAEDNMKLGWCNLKKVMAAQNIDRWHMFSSDLFYFRKQDDVHSFFQMCRDAFLNPETEVIGFNGDLPDEYAFSLGYAKYGSFTQPDRLIFAAWCWKEKPSDEDLKNQYYAYTIGGSMNREDQLNRYHRMVKSAAQRLRLPIDTFKITSKKRWNKNREFI